MKTEKMKVEIWSDVTCVHCYIAKRKLESALAQFNHASQVIIEWRSFELAPGLKVNKSQSMYAFLAEYNNASIDKVKTVCSQIVNSAKEVGLTYNFDIAKPANSFMAHEFSHLAKHHGLQEKAEEGLYSAHFTEGKDIDDITTLLQIANAIGLNAGEAKEVLRKRQYADIVQQDIKEAHQLGIKGVPHFRFNNKMAISGVQNAETYLKLLEESFNDWTSALQPGLDESEGKVCGIGGVCE